MLQFNGQWHNTPVTDVVGRQHLRSATQQLMVVPRHRLSTVGRRAFAVHGPMVWNSLPDDLRAQQNYESFRQGLKTGFSPDTNVFSALETFVIIALYKSTFTIPLPYHNYQICQWSAIKEQENSAKHDLVKIVPFRPQTPGIAPYTEFWLTIKAFNMASATEKLLDIQSHKCMYQ